MSNNKIKMYEGSSRLHCDCGNSEEISDENPNYKRFSSWWDTSSGRGRGMYACLDCNGEAQPAEYIPKPKS